MLKSNRFYHNSYSNPSLKAANAGAELNKLIKDKTEPMQHLSFAMIGNKCSKLEKTNGWTFWCLKWLSLDNLWFIRLNALGDKDLSSNTNVLMLSREGKAKYLIKEYAILDQVLNCCCSKLFYFCATS